MYSFTFSTLHHPNVKFSIWQVGVRELATLVLLILVATVCESGQAGPHR
jgi:hypothetical protein